MSHQKLVKSRDRIFLGVCGGIAEFIGWPKDKVRMLWMVLTLLGLGIIVYIILGWIMPNDLDSNSEDEEDFDIEDYRVE